MEFFSELARKCFKTTENHSLGEKLFLLIFVLFHWFVQKELFKQIQIFLWIFSFSNLLRKVIFLSISELLSEIVTFLNKMRCFQ